MIKDNENIIIDMVLGIPDHAIKRPESLRVFSQKEYPGNKGLSRVPPV
jgi:hypothetical protein